MCLISFSKKKSYSSKDKIDRFDGLPKWGYIDITSKCSHGCAWCYGGFDGNLTSEMNIEDFRVILDKLKVIGVTQITITGGEPTEHPQFLEFVKEAGEFTVHLCTHGDWSKDYSKDMRDLGVRQVQL